MALVRLLDLPYELMQYVLQCGTYVDSDATPDKEKERFLGACRLTCRALNLIAAPMVFQSVQFGSMSDWNDHGSLRRLQAFRDLVGVNRQIATYIQSFSIITNDCHELFQSPNIEAILSQLTCLRHFSLRISAIRPKLQWSQLTEAQAAALKKICSLPCLTTIEFAGMHGLPLLYLLEGCTNLEGLKLRDLFIDLDGYGSFPPTTKIKSLHLHRVKKSEFQGLELHDISLLKNLEKFQVFVYSGESFDEARKIVKAVQTTIKELHLQILGSLHPRDGPGTRMDGVSGFYDHPLSSLEKITVEDVEGWRTSTQLSPYIPRLLDIAEAISTVQHVHIYCNAAYSTVGRGEDLAAWMELDHILQEKYPALRELTVTLRRSEHTLFRHQDPKQVRDAVEAVKPLLKGVIESRKVSVRLGIATFDHNSQMRYFILS